MTKERKQLGNLGERLANQYLQKKHHRILRKNLKNKFGEIDLLTEDRGTIVLVEVKTKRGLHFGLPQEMVTPHKQQKLRKLALWISQYYPNHPIRVDVVAITMDSIPPTVEHLENVLEDE